MSDQDLRDLLLSRARNLYGDPELYTERGSEKDKRWRVVSGALGVLGLADSEGGALLAAIEGGIRTSAWRAERAAVIAYIRTHRDVADRRGGQHVGTGPNPSVQQFMLRTLVPDLEGGAHVAISYLKQS